MNKLTENAIEQLAIERLQQLGYTYCYAPDIAPDSKTPERDRFEQVILKGRLARAVQRINAHLPIDAQNEAIQIVERIASPDLLANNQTFHRLLTEGVPVTKRIDGTERGDRVWLLDFNQPENNDFVVCNQFTVVENHQQKRVDLILFVNGLPLVVMELKNPADENATIHAAFKQIETYQSKIPSLFTYNGWVVLSDGLEAKAGSISAGLSRYMAWQTATQQRFESPLETLIQGMLNPATLVDLIRHFIVFEASQKQDLATGIFTLSTVKKLASYHQYYAVNRAVASTLRASGYAAAPESAFSSVEESLPTYGLKIAPLPPAVGDRKGGVVWHTQGSGKSLSMVFYTGKIVLAMDNPTILVITDRNDLDDQLFDTFAGSVQLLRQEPIQVQDRNQLKNALKVASGGVVFTTIQKFQPETGNLYEILSNRKNIVVIADEAHRTQYGFKAKTVDEKAEDGAVIGKKVVYGFAKYLRDALPNATYLGFTGTPIERTDVNTPKVFGPYVDTYDLARAVADGATVSIYYESRLAKVNLSETGKQLIKDLDDELDQEDLTTTQKAKAKWTQLEALVGSENRIRRIAKDIITHFEQRQAVFNGKGMIVTMSRRIAATLYQAILDLKPEWHSDALNEGTIKVVMTSASSDGALIAKHHTTKEQRRTLAERMKDPKDALKLVIVRDMWLTGFDAPSLHTLYVDKPMKGHNLMQAITRVNRVYKDKPGGLIVDYLAIAEDLKKALSFYTAAGGKGDPMLEQQQAVGVMLEKMEVVGQMYFGFPYHSYFEADTAQKLAMLLAASDHILGLEDGKNRYIQQVTDLTRAFAIAIPHEQAMAAKDEIAFFQAVKARLAKFNGLGSGISDADLETAIHQVIDKALVSEKVIDIFDAAGIKKPDISILSDAFLTELKTMPQKNVALEVLKKLLSNEIKTRSKKNLIQSKTLLEMLEEALKRYHNKLITAAEVMDELIQMSKQIVQMDNAAQLLKLSDYEYAFYTAIADNDSARELMAKEQLRALAIELTKIIQKKASIDWTLKENVRADMRKYVKRTLRKFNYPPDMQLLATETVLKQAEMIAKELTKS
jgi:type I restriction enzyme, R subunit